MKRNIIVLILLLISGVLLTFNLSKEEFKEKSSKFSKIDKILEKPAGIQAYTYLGEETTETYDYLIKNKLINNITCKNGTVATYNYDDNSVTLSNINMPDYCVMDFKEGYGVSLTAVNGTVTEPASQTIGYNGSVEFGVSANANYVLTNPTISCDGGATGTINTSTGKVTISGVKASQACTITFQPNTHSVTLSVTGGTGGGTKTVSHGGSATFTISANSGYGLSLSADTCGGTLSGSIYTISNVTSDKSCSITLITVRGTLYNVMLADNPTKSTRSSFSSVFTSTTTGTLYTATESIAGSTAQTVYYYAGNTTNNWVKFGGFYWRIIRTNADGSVRLLYSGKESEGTAGTAAYIGTSDFNIYSSSPKYVGYMYGNNGSTLDEARTNTNDSTIKGVIDTWYASNLNSYTSYLSTTAVYCNDRTIGRGNYTTGDSGFDFASYTRLTTNKLPSYNCTNSNDAFSASTTIGNAKLTYPIGLMSADEIAFAGGYCNTNNASAWYYLNSGGSSITGYAHWFLLTPYKWGSSEDAFQFVVYGSRYPGSLVGDIVDYVYYDTYGVRPVISLKACALVSSGNGTPSTPYEIDTSSGC